MRRILTKTLVLAAALCMVSCTTSDVAPIETNVRPAAETDEAGLWLIMDKAEEDLQASAIVVRDPTLNAYVDEVFCRVAGEAYCQDIRVYIVEQPYFNANMAPNGMMQVWTGLLVRAENEAQLAFVLGHEFAHYRERHSLEQWREINNLANTSLFFTLGVAAAGVPDAAVLGNFAVAARLYGYGRDKEREADEQGFEAFTGAGYDGGQASAVWDYLISEVEASDSDRKKRQIARASIFSTHPVTTERVETLETYAADSPGGDTGEEAFATAVAPFLEQWLADDLVRRDFGEHIHLIDHKIKTGRNLGILYYRRGEAYRIRREEGDLDRALSDYKTAVTFDDAPVEAWGQLGRAYRRADEHEKARMALEIYLGRNPDAPDRAIIEYYLDNGEE